ncbi:MAG TPA: serine hydrolase domain-containing protein, partial [Candidatus Limnocylindrales bacterium]|nr:serine hydrolase domain-containing protein [Candidatus Limnocylindrales bacterium]
MPRPSSAHAFGLAVAALLVACGFSPSPGLTRTTSPTTFPSGPSARVDAVVAARLDAALSTGLADLGVPGVQAAVVFDDGAVWVGAAGESTPARPMTSDLLMPLASVTKVYTATLVLDLADDGVVDLDDPVTRWLPDAAHAEGVTLRQLLTHTSGIASDDPTLPPVCAPGSCYSYSNGGYQLLGQVIEAATGVTYAAALRERILAPLDLVTTFYPREEAAPGEEAIGHWQGEDHAAIAAATSGDGPGWLGASGGIVATAEDAARFADALFGGRVLAPATLAALDDVDVAAGLPGANDCDPAAMIGRR